VARRASFSTDEEAWKAYGSSRQRFYEWKPTVEALLAAEAAANPSTQPMEVEEPDEDDPAQQAEAAARLRKLHAQAQARYRERLRLAQAEAEALRLAEIKAEQQAAAAAYKEARRAARWMQQARRECRQVQWDELPNSCRIALGRFGFMRGLWNHRNSELGSRLGVSHLVRHEWYHAWSDLPRYFKTAAADLGYNSAEWQNEELGCATAGGGCTQRFLPGETESNDLSDDRGSACSDGELLLHSPRPCFTTVTRDTMDLVAESCRGYCDGPSAAYRPWGGCYVGGRMYDIHNGAEYLREEWSQTLRGL
jgi:predicted DNA-binding protein (UPF0251 family)